MSCSQCDCDLAQAEQLRAWRLRGWEDGWRSGWRAGFEEVGYGADQSRGDADAPHVNVDAEIDEEEGSEYELVLSPEWAARFARTEQRRQREKRALKRRRVLEESTHDDSRMDNAEQAEDGEVSEGARTRTGASPEEQSIGENENKVRDRQRIEQYGDAGAAAVATTEAAMNANYQIEMDRRQCAVWPVLPLR